MVKLPFLSLTCLKMCWWRRHHTNNKGDTSMNGRNTSSSATLGPVPDEQRSFRSPNAALIKGFSGSSSRASTNRFFDENRLLLLWHDGKVQWMHENAQKANGWLQNFSPCNPLVIATCTHPATNFFLLWHYFSRLFWGNKGDQSLVLVRTCMTEACQDAG